MFTMTKSFASLILALASMQSTAPVGTLEVRFSPDGHVYLAQDNRFLGVANFQIQNVAIINGGGKSVRLDEVLVEILAGEELVKSERLAGRLFEQRWSRLKGYLDLPGVMKAEDPRFRFRQLLGDRITLSPTTTLAPRTAIYFSRRFYFADAVVADGKPIWPDRIRVSVKGTTSAGARVGAENELRVVAYQPKNEYHFPVKGRWYIASSSSVRSHHRLQPVHEFALDVLQIGEGGSHKGDGTAHADYYAFGKEVHAMEDGVVVAVYDDVKETRLRAKGESVEDYRKAVFEPLSRSENANYATGGNQIVIEHPGGEHSSYAHLKYGSIRVKKGDPVKRGQVIAQVGLSGDGYEPHLHFQLTDGPDLNYARGIPMIFVNVKPVLFSSTLDIDGRRQLQTGEFVETSE